jgi:hypothetical protein
MMSGSETVDYIKFELPEAGGKLTTSMSKSIIEE